MLGAESKTGEAMNSYEKPELTELGMVSAETLSGSGRGKGKGKGKSKGKSKGWR